MPGRSFRCDRPGDSYVSCAFFFCCATDPAAGDIVEARHSHAPMFSKGDRERFHANSSGRIHAAGMPRG